MEQPRTPSDGSYNAAFAAALFAALVVLGVGIYLATTGNRNVTLLSVGIIAAMLVVVGWLVSASMNTWRAAAEAERAGYVKALDGRLHQMADLLSTLSQQQLLSDRAKAVAYRSKDRQALRDAIREEMNAKDWDAALVLANDMEREFGYVQEAAVLRADINNNRTEVVQRLVTEAIAVVEQNVQAEQWSQAVREAERVMQLYPNEARVQQLPAAIEQRRQSLKKQLRDSMDAAMSRHDVDGALEILRRLDPYLTPVEASGMQETVRGLFKDRLNLFKDQFTKAYQGHNYSEAIRIGEIVMAEHPNSRLALEVRDMMDSLRQRASAPAAVGQPQVA